MMKKMIAMLLCLLLGCGAALAETALDVVYASTYPAYSACDDNGVFSGFNVDLVQALADMDGELAVGKQWIQEPYDLLALRNISMSGENSLVLPRTAASLQSRIWRAKAWPLRAISWMAWRPTTPRTPMRRWIALSPVRASTSMTPWE